MLPLLYFVFFLLFSPLSALAATATLTWTDASTNEEGFQIERRIGTGAWQIAGKVAANVVTFSEDRPTTEAICYRVGSFIGAGISYGTPQCIPVAPTNVKITLEIVTTTTTTLTSP